MSDQETAQAIENIENPEVEPEAVEEQEEDAEQVIEPVPRFRIKAKSETIRAIVNAVASMVSDNEPDAVFQILEKGVTIRHMDESHVALVVIEKQPQFFTVYDVTEEGNLCLSVTMLNRVLSRAKSKSIEHITLSTTKEDKVRVSFNHKEGNQTVKTFDLPIMKEMYEIPPEPKLELSTRVQMDANEFYRALQDAEIVADVVKITTNGDSIRLNAQGDVVKAEINFDVSDTLDLYTKEETSSMYSLDYLLPIVKAGRGLSDVVTFEYSKDLPCKISFGLDYFWIAPRIEEN